MGTVTVAFVLAVGLQQLISGAVLEIGGSLMMLAAGVAGVVAAWLLHGRRIDLPTAIGAACGAAAGGLAIPLVASVSFVLGLPLRLVTDSEYAGPLALLVVISACVAALLAWLLTDAVRDLAPRRRAHFRLDVARIAAAAVFALLVVVSVYLVVAQPEPEQGEAPIWAMAGGLIAAGVVVGADVATTVAQRMGRSRRAVAAD
ncbi:MAG: hypothetical protein FDZ70_06685 [Actinobacteria bacterium]|nr:MAG: hypothetical protein FDZ70_06685 [Actinomycetota bacterium]